MLAHNATSENWKKKSLMSLPNNFIGKRCKKRFLPTHYCHIPIHFIFILIMFIKTHAH